MMEFFKSNPLGEGKPAGFYVGLAIVAVMLMAGIWWLLRPEYVPVYKNIPESDQAGMLAALSQRQIPYRINGKDSSIEVPEAQLSLARISLAEAGVPAKAGKGYELFDEVDYGMSEFAQKINYQRALEGELARTIMGLAEVKSARVHLTMRKNSLYTVQQEAPKASVILQLRESGIGQRQIRGIQQLVGSSVEGLVPEAVVVLDETGQPLSAGTADAELYGDRWQLVTRLESEMQQKVQRLLDRTFGEDKANVSVKVQMNFDHVKTVRDLPIALGPDGEALIAREKQMQSSSPQVEEGKVRKSSEQNTSEVEYAIGKSYSEIEHAPGKVENVSVGVVLSAAITNVDVQALDALIKASLGLNPARGDMLSIAQMPFAAVEPAVAKASAAPAAPEAAAPRISLGRVVLAVAALLVLGILAVFVIGARPGPKRGISRPPATPEERERMLVELRKWLRNDSGQEAP
ncbi:MAG: putative Flagellar M-ring protein [Microvirga sp.]|jgi:flagellar M-ring protein FliF|nr:putative Flagellar M-ring protein [Microvirga sp.]